MYEHQHTTNPEPLLYALARLFASDGAATEVAVLTYSLPELGEPHYDNLNGGTDYYTITLHVPLKLYTQIESRAQQNETRISERLDRFNYQSSRDQITSVKLRPAVVDDPEWRARAQAWLAGSGINNQGRVRSDNVAPLSADGLLFRSPQEINLYRALKSKGVSFAPLPVFVRGGDDYQRLEPDFLVIYQGVTAVVEVDGDTVHTETPAEAHARTSALQHEGIVIERVRSADCDTLELANATAIQLLQNLSKLKATR
ncbi:MAG: hypothetical protein R3C01_06370 [Planctomycetaceae bacterium]